MEREGGCESQRDPLMPILTSRTEAIISDCNSCALHEQTSIFEESYVLLQLVNFAFIGVEVIGNEIHRDSQDSGLRTQDSGPRPLLLVLGVQKVDCRGVLCALYCYFSPGA